jgi:hypothetical protein
MAAGPSGAPRNQVVTEFIARNPDLTSNESWLFAGLVHAMLPPPVVFAVPQRYVIQGSKKTVGALRD